MTASMTADSTSASLSSTFIDLAACLSAWHRATANKAINEFKQGVPSSAKARDTRSWKNAKSNQ
jgi:hypothetical protein